MISCRASILLAGSAAAVAFVSPASAQDAVAPSSETTSAANRTFAPGDFERFAPRTALDMVNRIPGFTISSDGGDGIFGSSQSQRGLGQADQNILLNGQRVSAKANDAASALSRIDAADVIRIEIIDGARLDIPGLTGQVANIVYRSSAMGGTFSWEPFFRERIGHSIFVGEVSANGRKGNLQWNASLKSNRAFRGNFGPESVYAPDGELLLVRDEYSRFKINSPSLAAAISHEADNGNILNVNLSASLSGLDTFTEGDIFDPSDLLTPVGSELSLSDRDGWEGELGADYEFALGGGRLKLIGLQRYDRDPSKRSFRDLEGDLDEFDQTTVASESVARSEYRWGDRVDWQVSLEGAYNRLESEAGLFVTPFGGSRIAIPLPGANATISEQRAEAILSYGRPLGETMTLQLNVGGEFSHLAVDGEAGSGGRSYWRPKGSALLSWRPSSRLSVNAEIERDVDQLSFGDILATVDLADDTSRSTNIALVPSQRWRARLGATQSFEGVAVISPYIEVAFIEDRVDTIPISPTEEALGNIPSARTFAIGGNATLELGALGWTGARLEVEGEWQDSSIEDPLLLLDRAISGVRDYRIVARLRHDIPETSWAYGFELSDSRQTPTFRLNQVSLRYNQSISGKIYVENKDVAGLTIRAGIDNLFDGKDAFYRDVYVDRRDGPLRFREEYLRRFGRIFEFQVKGSF